MTRCRWIGLLSLLVLPSAAPGQPVQGDVVEMGFRANVGSGRVIREGRWFPIVLRLYAQGGTPRAVTLRIERTDLDGDRVAFRHGPLTVTPGAGPRRAWCYAVTSRVVQPDPATVDVLDADGALLTRINLPGFELIDTDTRLILDVSPRRLAALDRLDTGEYYHITPGQRPFYRNVCVARLEAANLPDRWFGLEAVDTLVWDEPDPSLLNDPAQAAALLEWVRNGGQLILGIGAAWEKVRGSPLADILPFEGTGRLGQVRALPHFLAAYGRASQREFETPLTVLEARLRGDAVALLSDRVRGRQRPLLALRDVGFGQVIAATTRLGDLARYDVRGAFLRKLFGLNPLSDAFRQKEAEAVGFTAAGGIPLFPYVVQPTEFRAQAGLLMLLAFGFVGAYVVASTLVSWVWLRRRALTHLSWIAFSALAVAASAVSFGAVLVARGVVDRAAAFCFVDLDASSAEARVYAYLGYKSARRRDIDLSLDGQGSFLRPMAPGYVPMPGTYSTADRYAALPVAAALADVPLRATLKQFEGFWGGALDGRVTAQLTARRSDGRITPDSWIRCDLGADVELAYLLYIDPRLDEGGAVPARVGGLTYRTDRETYLGATDVPPAVNVLALRLPPLPEGQRVGGLGADEYRSIDERRRRWEQGPRRPQDEPLLPTLWHRHNDEWTRPLGAIPGLRRRMDPVPAAALVASTYGLLLHTGQTRNLDDARVPVVTSGLMDVDVTDWLRGGRRQGVAVLLLYVPEPAALGLHRNGEAAPLRVRTGQSLYRVRVPIRYVGRPPRPG